MILSTHFGLPRKAGEYWLDAVSILLGLICAQSARAVGQDWAVWVFELSVFCQVLYYIVDEAARLRIWKLGPQVIQRLQQGLPVDTPDFHSVPQDQTPQQWPSSTNQGLAGPNRNGIGGFFPSQMPQQPSTMFMATGRLKTLITWRTLLMAATTVLLIVGLFGTLF
ncbi:MAG: hypothetical protein IJH49_02465 [Aeriscardovia sp.]|nr:hypothetical protein [Aeriscardovia sp.]MBR2673552.1 hypothetical protein [Aeriscardovia sp.]